jgi:Fe-S cluster assembly iron-binding protein IscA
MDYVTDAGGKWDEVVEAFGVKVFIDPRALLHIVGSTMDFVDDHVGGLLPLKPQFSALFIHGLTPFVSGPFRVCFQ